VDGDGRRTTSPGPAPAPTAPGVRRASRHWPRPDGSTTPTGSTSVNGEPNASPAVITRLLTGTVRIRLTALTLEGLPDLTFPGGPPPLPEVVTARATVTAECTAVESWFGGFAVPSGAQGSGGHHAPEDDHLAPELVAAWDAVRRDGRRDGVIAVLRLLWVEERMADLRRLQADLAATTSRRGPRPRPEAQTMTVADRWGVEIQTSSEPAARLLEQATTDVVLLRGEPAAALDAAIEADPRPRCPGSCGPNSSCSPRPGTPSGPRATGWPRSTRSWPTRRPRTAPRRRRRRLGRRAARRRRPLVRPGRGP